MWTTRLLLRWICIGWVIVCSFLLPRQVHAQTVVFSDSFDEASLDTPGWSTMRNELLDDASQPCTGRYGTDFWHTLDQKLGYAVMNSPPCISEILPDNPAVADLSEFTMEFTTFMTEVDEERGFLIRWGSPFTWIRIDTLGNHFWAKKRINGVDFPIHNPGGTGNFLMNERNHIKIEYRTETGQIKLWLNSELVVDAVELPQFPKITTGKPGLMIFVENKPTAYSFYDNFQINIPGPENGRAPNWKQGDSRWAQNEYDHATYTQELTPPSIQAWGCALTSVAMVLQSHGFAVLPGTQTPIDPGTLNSWLKEQPDGYWPGGLINWRAISRLTALYATEHGGKKLEFTREAPPETEKKSWLQDKLRQQQPVILQQPGHFILADALGTAEEILIRDPAYERETLGSYQNTFESARVFTPSNTDLRAITLGFPIGVEVQWQWRPDSSAQWQTLNIPSYTETIGSSQASNTPQWKIMDISQPVLGEYRVELSNPQQLPLAAQLHTYSAQGAVETKILVPSPTFTQHIIVNSQDVLAPINLDTPQPLSLQTLASWLSWGELRSPWIVTLSEHYFAELSKSDTFEMSEQAAEAYQNELTVWLENGWLSVSAFQVLRSHSQQLLRSRWP